MKQDYYDKLAEQLLECVEWRQLGKNLERICLQYVDMLRDDVLDMNQKYQVSILVEDLLLRIRDIPIRKNKKAKLR